MNMPETQIIKTHIPLHPSDPNDFIIVDNSSNRVASNFIAKEFYNPKTGLASHPISQQAINCVQFLREYFNLPILVNTDRINGRTYRNYTATNGAKTSAHMLAEACDFNFDVPREKQDELILLIREDLLRQGIIFQQLFELGCRGFGVYDTFIHLDTVPIPLYPAFAAKRKKHQYRGTFYGFWDNTKKLRLLEPSGDLATNVTSEPTIIETTTKEVKKAAGTAVGFIKDMTSPQAEDVLMDVDEVNLGYLVAFFVGCGLGVGVAWLLVKKVFY